MKNYSKKSTKITRNYKYEVVNIKTNHILEYDIFL